MITLIRLTHVLDFYVIMAYGNVAHVYVRLLYQRLTYTSVCTLQYGIGYHCSIVSVRMRCHNLG